MTSGVCQDRHDPDPTPDSLSSLGLSSGAPQHFQKGVGGGGGIGMCRRTSGCHAPRTLVPKCTQSALRGHETPGGHPLNSE